MQEVTFLYRNIFSIKSNRRAVSGYVYVAILIILLIVALVVVYYYMSDTQPQQQDIVETAQANGSFDTLVTAIQTAGLVDTLKGEGPYTVFAPTDEAFNALPDGVLDSLLADKEALTQVLTYHVVDGRLLAADIATVSSVTTLEGGTLSISNDDGTTMIGPAEVTQTDIECTNGVIHVIDKVLVPDGIMNIVQTAQYYGLSTLVTAIDTAGLTSTLETEGPYTVFAPTNAAFDALPDGTLDSLLADPGGLAQVLTYHVVSGEISSEELATQTSLTTLEGSTLTISTNGGIQVNGANVVPPEIGCSNGVVHVVDEVLTPPM